MTKAYYVQVKGRNKYFPTLEDATMFCSVVFDQTGIVLGITKV